MDFKILHKTALCTKCYSTPQFIIVVIAAASEFVRNPSSREGRQVVTQRKQVWLVIWDAVFDAALDHLSIAC